MDDNLDLQLLTLEEAQRQERLDPTWDQEVLTPPVLDCVRDVGDEDDEPDDDESDLKPDTDYVAPRVTGEVRRFNRNEVTFSNTLCTIPDFVVILNSGQAIAYYADDDPPLPYDTLQELLEEHAQGCKGADFLRKHLEETDDIPDAIKGLVKSVEKKKSDDKSFVVSYSRSQLKAIANRAKAHWGEFAVDFRPRLA